MMPRIPTSLIYKVVLYEKYAKILLDRIEQRKKIRSFDENVRKAQTKKEKVTTKGTTGKTPSVTPPDSPQTLPTFEHVLTDTQLEHLTSIVKELHIFREEDITTEQIKSIFNCSPTVILKSKNNRLLAHLFDQLSRREYITEEWQAVIARNMLFKSSQKDDFLNQNDLSTATNKLLTMEKSEKYNKLEVFIKNLKNY